MNSDMDHVQEEASVHSRSETTPPSLPSNDLDAERDFILTFETLSVSWDKTDAQYTNKYKRNDNLRKLLPILKKLKPKATVDDVKKKINTIRCNYRRELKKIEVSKRSGAGAEEIYTPRIWYFPYLHFLRKLEQPVPLQEEPEPTYQSESAPDEAEQTNHQSNQQSREATQDRSFSSISTVPKPSLSSSKKRKQINHDDLLDRACRYLSEPCTQSSQQQNVPNPIVLEWSNTLDSQHDILFEAELGNLNRYSVRINDASSPSPHQTAPVTYTSTQDCSTYSQYSSLKNATLLSPPTSPSPSSQRKLITSTPLTTPQLQQTGPIISSILDLRPPKRGSTSQIIISSNYQYDQLSKKSTTNSNENTLHIPNSVPASNHEDNKSPVFSQFTP